MFRIDSVDNIGNLFSEGNPATGTPGTKVSADWLNAVQEEIVAVLTLAGITPNKALNNQLAAALTETLAAPSWTQLGTTGAVYYTRHAGIVFLRGYVFGAPGGAGVVGTLPAGFRPANNASFAAPIVPVAAKNVAITILAASGSVSWESTAALAAPEAIFFNLSFPAEG